MGLPQKRERVFFISTRKDLQAPKLTINRNQAPIPFKEVDEGELTTYKKVLPAHFPYWKKCLP
jgi:DNA (cytosine-5)-methyltransferase 1